MSEKRNIGSSTNRSGTNQSNVRKVSGRQDIITYNRSELIEEKRKIERIRYLESYKPVIPTPPSGAGAVFNRIQEIITDVENIYNQVDLLIDATVKALKAIEVEIASADAEAAKQYKK